MGDWRNPWYDRRTRSILFQVMVAALIAVVAGFIVNTTAGHLAQRNMTAGFGFLGDKSNVAIGEALVPFDSQDSYLRVVIVCGLNTVFVSLLSCVAATIVGTVVGVGRLAPNPLLRRLAGFYVTAFRNTPLLLQMIVWYTLLQTLPPVRQAYSLGGFFFLSQRGLFLPSVGLSEPVRIAPLLVIGALLWLIARRGGSAGWRRPATLALLLGGVAAAALLGRSVAVDYPLRRGFNFSGGLEMSPEFTALLAGLVLYFAAYIAENVRGGILAVHLGQWEAARALGLSSWSILRRVVLPQALRVIIPPLTLEYVGIIKSSSLGILVGYPELFWSVSTMVGQTGHAIEGIALLMLAYLVPSLGAAAAMNAFNRHLLRTGVA